MLTIPNVGDLATEDARRDAIHVAVAPVIAGEDLVRGDRVELTDGLAYLTEAEGETIGIVDPYLTGAGHVRKGQRFWLFLLPGSITSLRHVWSHPAFAVKPITEKEF